MEAWWPRDRGQKYLCTAFAYSWNDLGWEWGSYSLCVVTMKSCAHYPVFWVPPFTLGHSKLNSSQEQMRDPVDQEFPISRVLGFKGNLIFKCCRNGVFWDCPGDRKRCQHCEKGKLVKTPECVCSCEHVLISFTALSFFFWPWPCVQRNSRQKAKNEFWMRRWGEWVEVSDLIKLYYEYKTTFDLQLLKE